MNIVNISGSVGEQMFQYVFALWLLKADKDLRINIPKNNWIGRLFPLKPLQIASLEEVRELASVSTSDRLKKLIGLHRPKGNVVTDPSHRFRPELRKEKHRDCFFDGLWMAHQYADEVSIEAMRAFDIEPHLLPESSQELIKTLESTESVAIHIFRPTSRENTCTSDYYNWAITNIRSSIADPHFVVLTDDKQWAEEKLILAKNDMTIIEAPAESHYSIIPVLSHAKHNIIANNDESWWTAWLNKNPDKIVIAPKEWSKTAKFPDLFPSHWTLIPTT